MKRMMSGVFIAVLLMSLAACGTGGRASSWSKQYDLGVRYLSDGDYEEAIIAFTAAIEIDPGQAPAYVGRGNASFALFSKTGGDQELLKQARDDFKEAIGIDPLIVEAYDKLSEVYLELGDVEKAIGILREGYEETGDPALRSAEDELISSYASVDLTIERQDLTYTSEITGITTSMHYDLVTVKGEDRRIRRINQAIQEDFENFKTAGGPDADFRSGGIPAWVRMGGRHEWMYSYLNSESWASGDENDSFFMPCEVSATITCNENGILSIRYKAHYIYDYYCEYGMTFDLLTGEQIPYMEYFRKEREDITTKIRAQLQTIIDEQWAMFLDGIEAALEEDFDFSSLDFYIQNNELVVCSPRMGAGDGTVWTSAIPCGVYIDAWEIDAPGPAVVSFERRDHSILDPDGSVLVGLWYDLPVVEGNTPAVRKINRVFEELYDVYVSSISAEDWIPAYAENKLYPDEYFYTFSAAVTYNEDNILSVVHIMSWFMGGVFNDGFTGEVFDLKTGNQLGLRDLFYRDDDSLLAAVRDKITDFAENLEGIDDYRAATIASYTLDNLEFYIAEDGELIICIPEYELASGAAGALQIPCDLYIGVDSY